MTTASLWKTSGAMHPETDSTAAKADLLKAVPIYSTGAASSVMSEILYTPGKGWEFQNDLNYNFYHGYSAGFGRPEVQWDLGVSKAIKSVTLGLKVSDILNQTRNMNRIVTADYVEDRYKNVLGRYFLFNVTFNFGKVNAKKNAGIEKAMKNML